MIIAEGNIILADGTEIEINKKNLVNFDAGVAAREDFSSPAYGLISVFGKIVLNDNKSELLKLINNKKIKEGTNIEFWFRNNLLEVKTPKLIKIISEIRYDYEKQQCNFDLSDSVEKLQNIPFPEYKSYTPDTILNLFAKVCNNIPENQYILGEGFKNFDDTTVVPLPHIFGGSNWSALTEICEVSQKYIYQDFEGVLELLGE